jgi:hypothetical protein
MMDMLDNDFIYTLDLKIRTMETKITEEAKSLDSDQDIEHSEFLRVRRRAMTAILKEAKDSRARLAPLVSAFGELEPRFLKWRELRAVAREKRDKTEELAKLLETRRAACIPLENDAAIAEHKLQQHRKFQAELQRPEMYSTGAEIKAAKNEEEKLEKKYSEALSRLRAGKQSRDETQRDWFSAAKEADAAAVAERRGRLPGEAEEPHHSMGTLSSVAP